MSALTRKEVEAWPALGPMSLKAERVLAIIDALATSEATCNGYAQKAAAYQRERDEAQAERDDLRAAWAVLDEPSELRAPATAHDAAVLFKARLDSARASRDALADELAEARKDAEDGPHWQAQLAEARAALSLAEAATADAHVRHEQACIEAFRLREAARAVLSLPDGSVARGNGGDRWREVVAAFEVLARALAAPSSAAEAVAAIEQRARAEALADVVEYVQREVRARGYTIKLATEIAGAVLRALAKPRDPDSKPREVGCQCHLEEGDSPCPVHDRVEVVKFAPPASKPPCGGSRCWQADDGTWIHSSKSYGTCSVRHTSVEAPDAKLFEAFKGSTSTVFMSATPPDAKRCPRCGSTDFRCAEHTFCAKCTADDETAEKPHPYAPPDAKAPCPVCQGLNVVRCDGCGRGMARR